MPYLFVQRSQRLLLVLAAPVSLLLSQGQAKAILNVRIFDDGPNLKVTVDGSISGSKGTFISSNTCGIDGALVGQFDSTISSILCSGVDGSTDFFRISGPAGYGGNGYLLGASSVSGPAFQFIPSSYLGLSEFNSTYGIFTGYTLGTPISSSATFDGKSLASEGFTATGLIGTWTIDGTTESINVFIPPSPAAVPRPQPQVGAAAPFGFSRRLRKRITAPLITPPQA